MISSNIVLCFFILFCSVLPPSMSFAQQEETQAVIFMYHRFGESKYPSTNITLAQFDEQLDFLKKNHFTVLPLEDIVNALQHNKPLPDKSIGITIDDAYLSVYKEAYPRLKAKGYPFTVFVATGPVDQGIPAYMSWQQMREMQNHGATFANHSRNHDYLIRKKTGETTEAWNRRIRTDLAIAQNRLQEELGLAPALFAHPYGEYNLALMEIVQDLGYTGFGQHSGGVGILSDRRALPRFPVSEAYAEMSAFKTKALSFAMPVVEMQPVNPVTTEKRPSLTVTLAPSSANMNQLACYIGNKKMAIRWLEPGKRFQIQTDNDLPGGRSRYNCTAPDNDSGRYFWFSHPWIQVSEENPDY